MQYGMLGAAHVEIYAVLAHPVGLFLFVYKTRIVIGINVT